MVRSKSSGQTADRGGADRMRLSRSSDGGPDILPVPASDTMLSVGRRPSLPSAGADGDSPKSVRSFKLFGITLSGTSQSRDTSFRGAAGSRDSSFRGDNQKLSPYDEVQGVSERDERRERTVHRSVIHPLPPLPPPRPAQPTQASSVLVHRKLQLRAPRVLRVAEVEVAQPEARALGERLAGVWWSVERVVCPTRRDGPACDT